MLDTNASSVQRSSSTPRYKNGQGPSQQTWQKPIHFSNVFVFLFRIVCQPRLHPADLGGGGRSHPELSHRRETPTL